MGKISISADLDKLYQKQQQDWPAFAQAVKNLDLVQSRIIQVANSRLILQNNPARMRSTAARIDAKSLAERSCFLCSENRPVEQEGIEILSGKYVALVNPFPVLPNHFTVVSGQHVNQDIVVSLADFVQMSSLLSENSCLVFNGAKAGASAPDHLHFQIIPNQSLPLYQQLSADSTGKVQGVTEVNFAGASYLHFCSKSEDWIVKKIFSTFALIENGERKNLELLNLLAWRRAEEISVVLIPRKSHRPSCFYAEGSQQFLISPAAIELSGVLVLPREQDFNRLDSDIAAEIFQEICYSENECEAILNRIDGQS